MYNRGRMILRCHRTTCNSRRVAAAVALAAAVLVVPWGAGQQDVTAADEPLQPPAAPVPAADTDASLPVSVRVTVLDGLMEGDSTVDGTTNIVDAMFIAQHTVGLRSLDEWQLTCADTNDDGVVNIIDAMHIAQYTVDPTGDGGVLFENLWETGDDDGMLPPD